MRFLFLGGTGIISTACTELAVARGHDVTLLNRGQRGRTIPGAKVLVADARDERAAAAALGSHTWDAVVNFVAFKPEDIDRDVRLFSKKTGHYIFISSASAYQRPVRDYLVTESTPLDNPFWDYSRDKIASEERVLAAVREKDFPGTIIRPSLTYGESQVTLPMNSWEHSFTAVDRMRRGQAVIIPGDGSSLWTITHNSDFAKGLVGLLGNAQSIGHAFHITSDEVMTWDQYHQLVAEAAGVVSPRFIHIASDFISACLPDKRGSLLGDKASSVVFDNRKIKRFVPEFCATVPFSMGIRRTLAWFDADSHRQTVDAAMNQRFDRLIAAYERGLTAAKTEFGTQ